MGLIRLVLCTVPAILLLTSKQCAKAVGYIAVFSAFYAVQIYVLPHLTGILNFLVLFTTGFFCRILPSVAIAAYAVKTTTVSELISGMERIHMPKEVTIPLTVMFRFFPTVFQESEAISDAMKMRGIKLGGKKSSKILEYKLIPMITCSVKIGEELSAAAITRGLGAPVKRTNICQLKFNFADVVLILFCCFVVFWAIASPIISAGGISIHALREEGDSPHFFVLVARRVFLSTPSARRATITCSPPSWKAVYCCRPQSRPPYGGRG